MKSIVTVILILHIFSNVDAQSGIGGTDAPDGKYPYQAALKKKSKFHCGASIIDEHWLLTAAHCIKGIGKAQDFTVMVGTNLVKGDGKEYMVAEFIGHEDYDKDFVHSNDIALIRVAEAMKLTDKVQPVKLPRDSSKKYYGASAILTGWGTFAPSTGPPKRLQHVKVEVISNAKCEKQWLAARKREIRETQICTSGKMEDNMATYGDSGSPLVSDGVQIGVVSFAWDGLPDVFTRVTSYLSWIESHMAKK